MRVNSDFSEAIGVDSQVLDWVASPMKGVDRRMLDRVGGEVARATSIVRYAQGSHFPEHTHGGGEEFIVLEGVFQDEHGDYPAGTYVRNPVGTRHIPRSDQGCTIFVKLWQFDPDDQSQFAVDLADVELSPDNNAAGIARARLHDRKDELVLLEQWSAGAVRQFDADDGVELLVMEGSLEWQGRSIGRYGWIRLPVDWRGSATAGPCGAKVWIKMRHLAQLSLPPS